MLRDEILALLRAAEGGYCSGEAMSETLGVSRAAVWKGVTALREDGYQISSAPRRGYRLESSPDRLDPAVLAALLPPDQVVGRNLICLDSVDSTNNECKRLAADGAPEGTVVVTCHQTSGRGRRGRSFLSPEGAGLYLSVLLRPAISPAKAVNLTAWTAVAVCTALERACGLSPSIKWPNDILAGGKKLCGILTEMGIEGETGALDYVVAGIGTNFRPVKECLPPDLWDVATSLTDELGAAPRRDALAAALMTSLEELRRDFPARRDVWLDRYRRSCVTLGREVCVLRPGSPGRTGRAVDVDDQFRLLVDFGGGAEAVDAGEVSVRGLLGYA